MNSFIIFESGMFHTILRICISNSFGLISRMLATNITRQFFTQIIGILTGFFISIFTSRILGVEGRGEFALLLNTSSFLTLLFSFGLGATIVHTVSTNKTPIRNTINSIGIIIILLILICFLLLFFSPFQELGFLLPRSQNLDFSRSILLILFTNSLLSIMLNSILNGKQLFRKQQNIYFLIAPLSLILYTILFFLKSKYQLNLNLNFFTLFYILVSIIPTIGAYYIYIKNVRPVFSFSLLSMEQLKYILNFSLIAYIANILQFLSYRMDFWFIEYFRGNKDLGIYSLSVNLAQMLWLLPQAIATILVAYSGAKDDQSAITQTNTLCRITFNLILLTTFILECTIGYIIPFLYGEEFTKSAYLFKLLLIGIAPFSITTIIAAYFVGNGKIKINLFCSLLGFIVCLTLDIILVPKFGNIGASIATVFSYLFSTIFIIYMYIIKTKSSIWDLIIVKKEDILLLKTHIKTQFLQKKG